MGETMRRFRIYPVHTGNPLCSHGRVMYSYLFDVPGEWVPLIDVDGMVQVIQRITSMVVVEVREREGWQWFILEDALRN